ncbi:dTDP-4-dehydrorhamnose 3,5-epimerase [Marinobacterium litorale]|uniref:dTDP-4-dehydrorhamnose 3,5-epimerase n=1 Tax=Marinobacterium litorale TaxID=404770 RepID=UPI00041E8C18|nr:dTDP-4-dehydrorhamnose 3,5-epimerase [Marinobacterium litorale]
MIVTKTKLPGVLIIEPRVHGDERGFFLESFQAERYRRFGIDDEFVQDNHSRSRKGVLRGLHFQNRAPQGKLVRCARGAVFDVAADVNPASPTFGEFVAVELSDINAKQLWIPPGYAHGFCVLSEIADFEYKCTGYYDPADEAGVRWDDPTLSIPWPLVGPVLSEKDKNLPLLRGL